MTQSTSRSLSDVKTAPSTGLGREERKPEGLPSHSLSIVTETRCNEKFVKTAFSLLVLTKLILDGEIDVEKVY